MLYKDDIPNVEVRVQVNGAFEPSGDVVPSHLPGGPAATAMDTGPMHRIGDAHQAIVEWCERNGHRMDGRRWEICGQPDPSTGTFCVELYWSVQPV
jgi:effector-binding domain-containing protein